MYGSDENSIYSLNSQLVHNVPHYQELQEYPKSKLGLPTPTMEQIVITPSNDLPTIGQVKQVYQDLRKNQQQYYQIGNAYDTGAYCYNNPNCMSTSPLSRIHPAAQNSIYQFQTKQPKDDISKESSENIGRRRPERRRERRQERRQDRRQKRRDDGPFGPEDDDETECDKIFAHCEELGRYEKCFSPKCTPCTDKKGRAIDYAGSGCVPRKKTGCYEYSGCPL